MAFKMKGNPMKRNFGLPGINNKSEGNTDRPDGRSASSAFQYKSPVKKGTYAEAIKKDPNLPTYIKKRKTLEKGSAEWNANQNKINKAYGDPTRHGTTAKPKPEPKPEPKPKPEVKERETFTGGTKTVTKTDGGHKEGGKTEIERKDAKGRKRRVVTKTADKKVVTRLDKEGKVKSTKEKAKNYRQRKDSK
tara:strand:- start:203 stop:775 length:573 start_codon:yes stop_codon:yes gene_type:complete